MRSYLENKNRSVFNGVRFILDNAIEGERQLATAPDGWTSEFVLERNTVLKGVFRQISDVTLQFVEDGKDYIEKVYKEQGVNATITMRVDYWNNNYEWENVFTGIVDLFTLRITDFSVDCQIEDNAALAKFMRRKKNEINLFRELDLDDNSIPSYQYNDELTLPQQQIQTDSVLSAEGVLDPLNTPRQLIVIPLEVDERNFLEVQKPMPTSNTLKERAFFREALADYSLKFEYDYEGTYDVVDDVLFKIIVYDSNDNIRDVEVFALHPPGSTTFAASGTYTANVLTGDSVLFVFDWIRGIGGVDPVTFSRRSTIKIVSVSPAYPEVSIKGVNILDAYKRLAQMTSGLPVVSSFYEHIGANCTNLTSGKNVRGIEDDISLSIEKLAKSSYAIHNAGVGFDGANIVVEHIDHFYKPNVVLDLTKRTDAYEREVSDGYFPSVNIGYQKSSSAAKFGLGEPNTKSEYSTPINFDNNLTILSPYRGDTTGLIKLRETPTGTRDNESASGDDDIWFLDTIYIVGQDKFFVKQNQGFENAPSGWVNLNNTPARMIRRHRLGEYLKNINFLRLQKKEKYSLLDTKLTAEPNSVSEQGDIPVSDLPTPRWIPEIITGVASVERSEIKNLDPTGLVKVDEGLYGWIEKLVINYEQCKVEFELLRCNLDNVTPI